MSTLPVIARSKATKQSKTVKNEEIASLSLAMTWKVGRINSTTEAIPFLKTDVSRTYKDYLNLYDLDSIYVTNIKRVT